MGGWAGRARQVGRKGYTLVELVVVVGIVIVMGLIALPFFTTMMQGSRLDAAARQLAGDVREARSKATLMGWECQIKGFNVGGGSTYKNQYRLLGRRDAGVLWPDDTGPNIFPPSATQLAGPWVNFNQVQPGVSLNPSNSNPSFYVSFNSQGVAYEWNPTSDPWMTITGQSGSYRQLRITSAGNVKIQ